MHKISLEENRGKERQAGKILQERTRKLAVRFLVYNLSCLLIFFKFFTLKDQPIPSTITAKPPTGGSIRLWKVKDSVLGTPKYQARLGTQEGLG